MYFPARHRFPLVRVENGSSAEIAVVGNEGWWVFRVHGGRNHAQRAVVQSAGQAGACAPLIKNEFHRPAGDASAARYTQALITQMAQTAVCNGIFARQQRAAGCCEPGPTAGQRTGDDPGLIANMLAYAARASPMPAQATEAGPDPLARGRITVLAGRPGGRTCECYRWSRRNTTVLPDQQPSKEVQDVPCRRAGAGRVGVSLRADDGSAHAPTRARAPSVDDSAPARSCIRAHRRTLPRTTLRACSLRACHGRVPLARSRSRPCLPYRRDDFAHRPEPSHRIAARRDRARLLAVCEPFNWC